MLTRACPTREALVQFGLGTADITPPVGIYHRMFGAANHDRATGVHRPLQAQVLAIGRLGQVRPEFLRVDLDHIGFVESQHNEFIRRVSAAAEIAPEQVVVGYSHTHSAGWYMPDRFGLPGGELIPAYLETIGDQLHAATRDAIADLSPAHIAYATGRCAMAAHRDCWDEVENCFVCGHNPGGPCDDTVTAARVSTPDGAPRAILVHYGCHPTTLGWDNSLISPDFIGAMREVVSSSTGVPCLYWQGACGDLGPRDGFVGDPAVADRNGRMLGFAALSALEALGPPETEFRYAGPVVSGATLGTWKHVATDASRRTRMERVDGSRFTVPFPIKPHDDPETLERDRAAWEKRANAAEDQGDTIESRDCRAKSERAKRWLGRIANLPKGTTYPLSISVHRVGESLWMTSGGEPYQQLAADLRQRFPEFTVLYSPLAGGVQTGYLLPHSEYGKGVYQEEPSVLASGCFERLREVLFQHADDLLARGAT